MRRLGRHRKTAAGTRASTAPSATATRVYLLMCVVLVATAALLVGRYFTQTPPPPAPPGALGAIPAAVTAPSRDGAAAPATPAVRDPQAGTNFAPAPPAPTAAPPFSLPPAPPVSVRSSTVGINSALGQVGLNTDGTIEVPTSYAEAAWYRLGPPPGSLGPAVITGHVDSYKGPGVFFNLGDMRPGQTIDVTRADRSVAHFRVDAINSYPKDRFPTEAVYGPINYAGLRLVTCGGPFDKKTRNYENNVVVYATLIHP